MTEPPTPQLYLVTPGEIELSTFPGLLSEALDGIEVACVRLASSAQDADQLSRETDVLRDICYGRDVPLVIERHINMVERLGLDGLHLTDGSRSVRKARKELGPDRIIGAFCGASRHDGMSAAEAGADYVSFGPVAETPLGDGTIAPLDLFAWWSEMIEVPVVAEGPMSESDVAALAPAADFLSLGGPLWSGEAPLDELKRLVSATV